MVIWTRLLLPSGITIQINSPGTDPLGTAGQSADEINTHFLSRFSESALLSLIGAGTANTGIGNQDQYNSAAAYRMAITMPGRFELMAVSSVACINSPAAIVLLGWCIFFAIRTEVSK